MDIGPARNGIGSLACVIDVKLSSMIATMNGKRTPCGKVLELEFNVMVIHSLSFVSWPRFTPVARYSIGRTTDMLR
jgi:hypothetical protein